MVEEQGCCEGGPKMQFHKPISYLRTVMVYGWLLLPAPQVNDWLLGLVLSLKLPLRGLGKDNGECEEEEEEEEEEKKKKKKKKKKFYVEKICKSSICKYHMFITFNYN